MAVILGNPVMIAVYQAGIPGNGEPFPDGAGMAGQQTLRGQRRVGLQRVRLRCRDRHVQARHHGELAAAGQRRQVWVRVSHDSESPGLRFHRVCPQMKLAWGPAD
jgi:hypothetical protein